MNDDRPPFRYHAGLAAEIEQRWQRIWAADGTFESANPAGLLSAGFDAQAGRPKCYVLDMFPYASGIGLHVGHPVGYIGTDVFARYQRMNGAHVLHAMGYDAFGLPAEQHAISTGRHPAETARENIAAMRAQLRRLGLGHDLRREISTADPGYYRWTQWIFTRIFGSWWDERTGTARPVAELVTEHEAGLQATPDGRPWDELTDVERRRLVDGRRLAYLSEETVNWCPGLGTVLSNEEVTADGRSDVGNYPVYRRAMRQWMLRITAFADRLAADLDLVDWPESIKQMQRNWIGASDGALITLHQHRGQRSEHSGVQSDSVSAEGSARPGIEVFTTRPDTLPAATFVVLAPEHPAATLLAPRHWPAGTPAGWTAADTPLRALDDFRQRAAQFSERQRVIGPAGAGTSGGVFTGGYVTNPATGQPMPVFVADYVLMSYGTGAITGVPEHDQRDLEFSRRYGIPPRPAGDPAAGPDPAGNPEATAAAISAAIDWLERTGTGRPARSYRLRDWLFSRQRYWGEPFPIVYDGAGLPVALPDDLLPVELPEIIDFRPAPEDGAASEPEPPLARAADWVTVELDLGDGQQVYRRELNTMPQWAGSCWYYLRYLDPGAEDEFVDPRNESYWMAGPGPEAHGAGGVDLYVGGVEHAVLHLLYARFWHKVLYDLGYVSTAEPFGRLFNQGYILADAFTDERGRYVPAAEVVTGADGSLTYRGRPVTARTGKMGKSLKNGISPEDMYRRYGADTLRLYEMAMGPLDTDRPWRPGDVAGMHRFLQRLWRAIVDEHTGTATVSQRPLDEQTLRSVHQTIMAVRDGFGALRFHTAIARLIELTTSATRITARDGSLPRALAEPLVLMLAPLAPHVAEELWQRLGHSTSLAYEPFPVADESLAAEPTVRLPVQVNGKTRFTIEVAAAVHAQELERVLAADPRFTELTGGRTVERLVIVPGRIINVLVR
ncbi:MAG TPA: leucine--tRNA ligase [Streptosporangiaceae bacterium]|nr:leucine--tRNA ligase [Streptosporangiaceae bacterium]